MTCSRPSSDPCCSNSCWMSFVGLLRARSSSASMFEALRRWQQQQLLENLKLHHAPRRVSASFKVCSRKHARSLPVSKKRYNDSLRYRGERTEQEDRRTIEVVRRKSRWMKAVVRRYKRGIHAGRLARARSSSPDKELQGEEAISIAQGLARDDNALQLTRYVRKAPTTAKAARQPRIWGPGAASMRCLPRSVRRLDQEDSRQRTS